MNKPSIVNNALKYLNQEQFLDFMDQPLPYPRSVMIPVVELGINRGAIQAALACVPTKGVLTLVDIESFQREFDFFVSRLQDQELGVSKADILKLLEQSLGKGKTFKKSIMYYASDHPRIHAFYLRMNRALLPVIEKFCSKPEDYVRLAACSLFRPSQNPAEISGLLRLIDERKPKQILEIGTNRGGTLYLFARVADHSAKLVSIDICLQTPDLLESFARKEQQITLIEADSTHPSTIEKIGKLFPNGIDFLFLDGDHSYDGIKTDFQNYAPLVVPGGVIACHDIVEDNETRYGVVTGGWAGGVPRFWDEVRQQYEHTEFVYHLDQDGQGIGVIFITTT